MKFAVSVAFVLSLVALAIAAPAAGVVEVSLILSCRQRQLLNRVPSQRTVEEPKVSYSESETQM